MRADYIALFGHRWLLFDIGGAVAAAGILIAFASSAVRNGVALYNEERL
jgi:hypothetical protein